MEKFVESALRLLWKGLKKGGGKKRGEKKNFIISDKIVKRLKRD